VWAYATLSIPNVPLLSAITAEAKLKIMQFDAQNLSNTVWALATLAVKEETLLYSIAHASSVNLRNFNT